MAVNIRLRKEEEEALRREGNGDNGNGYKGRGGDLGRMANLKTHRQAR